MNIVHGAQIRLRPRLAQGYGAHQSWYQLGEAKTAIESIGRLGQVAPCGLGLPHGVAAATDGASDVAEQHIDPARAFDLGGCPAAGDFQHGMRMTQTDDASKASQSVTEHLRARRQAG